MSAADDEPNIRYTSFHDDGRGGFEMKAANTASSQHGLPLRARVRKPDKCPMSADAASTTYVRQVWIKSS
jgi:hypothetical protein